MSKTIKRACIRKEIRRTRENVVPLLNRMSELVTWDVEMPSLLQLSPARLAFRCPRDERESKEGGAEKIFPGGRVSDKEILAQAGCA